MLITIVIFNLINILDKVNNVNDETIWNLRVLTCHRKEAI